MADGYTVQDRPRRRRGRRLLITLVVLLVLLAAALFAADRFGVSYAERRIAEQVSAQVAAQGMRAATPDVTVGGFPFLNQVAAGRYEDVTVRLRDVTSQPGGALPQGTTVQRVDIKAKDVAAPLDTLRTGKGDIVAKTVDGTVLMDYASVAKFIDQPGVRLSEREGKLAVTAPLEILGLKLIVNGTADLSIEKNSLRVRFRELAAEGLPNVPGAQGLVNGFAQQLSFDLGVGDLPFDLQLQEVRPLPEGLRLTGTAKDVPLNRVTG